MSKAILIMDKPKSCYDCDLNNSNDECVALDFDTNFLYSDDLDGKMKVCPLRDMDDCMEATIKSLDNLVPIHTNAGAFINKDDVIRMIRKSGGTE